MSSVYIAAPIFNDHQREVVDHLERGALELGYTVFSPYKHSQAIFKGRAPRDCTEQERRAVLVGNVENLATHDLLLAWVGGKSSGHGDGAPAKTDTGVVWELGYHAALRDSPFGARGQLAYLHDDDAIDKLNIMLAGTVDGAVQGMDVFQAMELFRQHGPDALRQEFSVDKLLPGSKDPVV